MLMKLKRNDSTPICGKKTFRFLSRMTRSKSSPYQRMDLDGKEMRNKKLEERKAEDLTKGKESIKTATPKEVKEKKSKKKRIVLNGKQNRNKKLEEEKAKVLTKGKENIKTVTTKEVKGKESKNGGWKKVGQICLTTCRYIGMGAAHMSPATVYASPDYHVDPKVWNKSFSHSYKPKVPPPVPHWTSTMMYSAW